MSAELQIPDTTKLVERPRLVRSKVAVFNPMNRAHSMSIGGRSYHWGPLDSQDIEDEEDYPRSEDTNELLTNMPKKIVRTAAEVAKAICGDGAMGPKGFVILQGSPEEQQRDMRKAMETYAAHRVKTCEEITRNWESMCAQITADGSPPPRRPRKVVMAYEDLERYQYGATPRGQYICQICGFDTNDEAKFNAHKHPGKIVPKVSGEAPAPAAPGETKREGPPRDPEAGAALIDRAARAGVELSVADQKGLRYGDPQVIGDVRDRIDRKEGDD